MTSAHADVLIVGGGVMGCAVALELARRGVAVRVFERSVPGAEASSAAAGMLAAQVEAKEEGTFFRMCLSSRERFARWAEDLQERTGIDIEHRRCGILKVAQSEAEARELSEHVRWQMAAGLPVVGIEDVAAACEVEPALSQRSFVSAAHFPSESRVDPPRYLRALRIAAERAGARFTTNAIVQRVVVEADRARGVEVEGHGLVHASDVVVAAGAWSNLVPGVPLGAGALRPARGQIIELSSPAPQQRGIVWGGAAYLSPRDDGRVLVGSTLEFVGFEKAVTAGAVSKLLAGALGLLPALADAQVVRFWSALRPYTPDELPLIGRCSVERLWLATGHFRNGILLSPITAEIVASKLHGDEPPFDASSYEAVGMASPALRAAEAKP